MKDPQRLLDEGATGFETQLLRSGRKDGPSDHNRRAIAAALGVGGIFGASTVATGASASARTWLAMTTANAVKVAAGVVAGAAAIYAGVEVLDAPAPPPPPAVVVRTAPVKAPAPRAAEPAPAPVEEKASEPAAKTVVVPAPAPERAADTLSLELQALDQARRALNGGDAALALTRIDDYTRRFPKRTLGAEATVLRIEALTKSGNKALALRLGREFLNKQPNGPYARRVQSLIGEPPGP